MSTASRIVIVQALLGVVCMALFFALSIFAAKSAALALLTSWIPSAYYAWVQAQMFNAQRLLLHGVLKTLLTLTLMAVCIAVIGIEPVGFFVTFAVMQLSYLTR